jgi:predicted amidohydrolase
MKAKMDNLNVLMVQADLGWKQPEENRAHLEAMIEGSEHACDLLVLPETFTTGFLGDAGLPEEGMDGPTVDWMKRLASKNECAVAGSAIIVEEGSRFNRFLFMSQDGSVSFYDKRHLFAFGGESERYQAGKRRVVLPYRGWRICLQVCYDLRFPAWCRNRGDYDLMLLVANWPSKRVAHWLSLLQARAIENQSWVIGLNRVGEDGNGIPYPGNSVVHDPTGQTMAQLDSSEQCYVAELDLAVVRDTRAAFPFQRDADRFELKV